MMLICAWPSAGPTGGAGVALPASICSFTDVCTFFGAICRYPESLFIVDRRRPRLRSLCFLWHRHSCLCSILISWTAGALACACFVLCCCSLQSISAQGLPRYARDKKPKPLSLPG